METNNKLREALKQAKEIARTIYSTSDKGSSHEDLAEKIVEIANAALATEKDGGAKKPGAPNAVKTGDMLLAENERLRRALSDIAENLRIHMLSPTQTISMNRREVECMVNYCEKALGEEGGAK